MIIPQKILSNPITNKILVDVLSELDRRVDQITVIEIDPDGLPESACILYNRETKQLLISDSTEWRYIDTQQLEI